MSVPESPDAGPSSAEILNSRFAVLFVGDPHLGAQGEAVLRRRFSDLTCLVWDRHAPDAADRAREIRGLIRARPWDLAFSFYNDLIFAAPDLARMSVPLNIHPARPLLPGVGHDTLPLLQGHPSVGATLHLMIEQVDAGPIVDVIEAALPAGSTRSQLRALTQALCLNLLETTAAALAAQPDVRSALAWIESRVRRRGLAWQGHATTRRQLAGLLSELESREPGHPVFR